MLSQLCNRRPPLKPQPEETKQEIDIINSFYEERKSRSISAKQHNLLKKNISYFHQQNDQENNFNVSNQYQSRRRSRVEGTLQGPLSLKNSNLSHLNQTYLNDDLKKTRNHPSLPQIQFNDSRSQQSLSKYSTSNIAKGELTDSQYREQLKNQLSKRVSIKSYLSDLSNNEYIHSEKNKMKFFNQEVQNNYRREINRHHDSQIIGSQYQQIAEEYDEKEKVFGKESDKRYSEKRESYEDLLAYRRKTANQSKNSRKSSEDEKNKEIQFSKNECTERTQVVRHTFGSEKSSRHNNSLLSQESAKRSLNQSKKKSEKEAHHSNLLNSQQLSQLQYNSHPLRQIKTESMKPPLPIKLKYNYFDPQQQANYKRKIQDLQSELQQLKAKHKREQKFIQSIAKMKRTMQGKDEEQQYSLKQLWRWIKQLPVKKY